MKINHYFDRLLVVALIAFTISATISCKKLSEPSFSFTQIDNPEDGEERTSQSITVN
jgi:hypothetical protein